MRPTLLIAAIICSLIVINAWADAASLKGNEVHACNNSNVIVFGLIYINSWPGTTSSHANEVTASNNFSINLSGVPDVRQSNEYLAGAAALQAVLAYYGRDVGEDGLRELLFTKPDEGTYADDIVRVAKEIGFEAVVRYNLTIDDLKEYLKEGVPVIVDVQAWRDSSEFNESWSNIMDAGDWMVVIGMNDRNIYLEDPYILGSRGYMSIKEFELRWHNAIAPPSDYTRQDHVGVVIRTDKPVKNVPFKHID